MFVRRLIFITALFLGLTPPIGFAKKMHYVVDPAESLVEFRIDSTLHEIHGMSPALEGTIIYDEKEEDLELPVHALLPVESLKTGIGLRDKAMYKMFDTEVFPVMKGTVHKINCADFDDQDESVCTIEAGLMIRDIEHQFKFNVNLKLEDNTLFVTGGFDLTTTQFKLKPPSLLGIFRCKKDVSVTFRTLWRQVEKTS